MYAIRSYYDQITELYNNGVVLKSDLLRAQLQLSQQETNLLTMENNLELSMQQLNILIGNEDDQVIKPIDGIEGDVSQEKLMYADYLVV